MREWDAYLTAVRELDQIRESEAEASQTSGETVRGRTDQLHATLVEQAHPLVRFGVHEADQPATDAFLDGSGPTVTGQGAAEQASAPRGDGSLVQRGNSSRHRNMGAAWRSRGR